jgi:3-hydroxybutyryl-CoA dehydrogenase
MEIKKVGVVGCGLMGSEYVQVCAQAGYPVVVSEVSVESLNKGLAVVKSRLTESVKEGKLSPQAKDAILGRIKGTTDIRDLADCDLVEECVPDIMEAKKRVFAELDKICPGHAILATNTSVLSIIDMAMATARPDKVLGIHGAPLFVPISEMVKTLVTSDETLATSQEFVRSLGMSFITVPDVPGFMTNRVWQPFLLSAVRVLEAGIASRDDIDTFFTKGFGLPIGPLAALDRGGLDTVLFAMTSLYEELKDPTYAPPVLLKKMVAAGWLGCKTGKGFYEYK